MAYNNYGYNNNNNGGYNKGGYNNNGNGGYNKQQAGNNTTGKSNKVGSVWKGTTKTGSEYLSIVIGDKKYVAFVNTYKNAPNQPDFNIMESNSNGQNAAAQNKQNGGYNNGGQNSGYNNQQGGGYKPAGNGGYGATQNGYGKPTQAVQEQNNVDAYYEAQNMPIGRGEFPKNEFDNSVADISDLPGNDMPVF